MGIDVDILKDGTFDIEQLQIYTHIILSPGPGLPVEKESLFNILKMYSSSKRILGICLGMQGIAQYYGGSIYNQEEVRHGVSTKIQIKDHTSLFRNVPDQINVGLYHSWACELPVSGDLKTLAISSDNILMAIQHKEFPVFGVQFHPESILTHYGKEILFNFINFMH
jgi:anthranilate synthase component 2